MICRRFSNPLVTPSIMFAISERDNPCSPRLNPSSSPRGPFTATTLFASTATSTPLGISTGFFPIRLIRSPHESADPPADPVLRRGPVRNQPVRGGHDRDPEPTHHTRQVAATAVDAPSGLRDPPDTGDRALLARAVLHAHAERLVDAFALLVEPLDVALLTEDLEDRARPLRYRREGLVLVRDVGVADAREQISHGIRDVRGHLRRGYHDAFVTPGNSPRCASSRKQIRHSRK